MACPHPAERVLREGRSLFCYSFRARAPPISYLQQLRDRDALAVDKGEIRLHHLDKVLWRRKGDDQRPGGEQGVRFRARGDGRAGVVGARRDPIRSPE